MQCTCGTKKASCKNKEPGSGGEAGAQNINVGRSAFERHQIAMEKSRQEISVSVLLFCSSINIFTVFGIFEVTTLLVVSSHLL